MGAWGTGVFSDDLACDIRDEFRDLIAAGLSAEAATAQLEHEHASALADPDEAPVFWIALALTQWRLGRLVPEVKQRALTAIDDPRGLERWTDPKLRHRRETALAKARAELLAPAKPPSRVARRERSTTPLAPGDVGAYTHDSGRRVALWVTANKTDKGGTYSRVLVAAVGQPDLPALDQLVSGELPAFTIGGRSKPLSLLLMQCQRLRPDRWRIVGNFPWPDDRRLPVGSTGAFVNPPPRATRLQAMSLDRLLDRCFDP